MSARDRYRSQMLEHLYGLLDSEEVRELNDYLASPEGEGLRAEAEQLRDQIAGAARSQFPQANFVAPTTAAPVRPATRQLPTEPTIRGVWTRWVVAASLLLVVGGLGGPAGYQFIGWLAQSRETRALKVALDDRRKDLRLTEEQHRTLRDEFRHRHDQAVAAHQAAEKAFEVALDGVRKAVDQKGVHVRLTGPARVQPGAPNEWLIEALTPQGAPASPKRMEVVVRDSRDSLLLKESHAGGQGRATFTLPSSLWEKVVPGTELFLEVAAVADDNERSVLAERIPLAGPVWTTHLVTDRPLYQPGETVRFRSLTLDRSTFRSPDNDLHIQFRLKNPDGALIPLDEGNGRLLHQFEPVIGPDGNPLRGIGCGEYDLPDDSPAGTYTLEVAELRAGEPNETVLDTRTFLVHKYVPEKLQKGLEFGGKSYGPGDVVRARLRVSRLDGAAMGDARVDVEARVGDGKPFHVEKGVRLDHLGRPAESDPKSVEYDIGFSLPKDLAAGPAENEESVPLVLSVTVHQGNLRESIRRQVPLAEKKLTVEFFPEGGDLVEGVLGRVYFQARTSGGRPADVNGVITDGTDTVAEVATVTDAEHPGVNRGQGVFSFTPRAGKKYLLRVKSPIGIAPPTANGYPLPDAKADGVVLTVSDIATESDRPIEAKVQIAKGSKFLHIGTYARGHLIGHRRVEVSAGTAVKVKLSAHESFGGVTRITVFEEVREAQAGRTNLVPRAERLVYRKPDREVRFSIRPDKASYAPGARVALEIQATDEKGRPAAAVLLVGVVNQRVIAMADSRTERQLPTHFLLAGEVRNPSDLEHADFLLTDHPKAGVALDLVLGTQGWRRFAEQGVPPADPAARPDVERLLVSIGGRPDAPRELRRLEEQRLAAEYMPKLELTGLRVMGAAAARDEYQRTVEPLAQQQVANARLGVEVAERELQKSAAELYVFETRVGRLRSWALPAFLIGLILLGGGGLALAGHHRPTERRRYVLSSAGAFAAAAIVFVAVIQTRGTPEVEQAYVLEERQNEQRFASIPPGPSPARTVVKEQGTQDKQPVRGKDPRGMETIPANGDARELPRRGLWQDSPVDQENRKARFAQRTADALNLERLKQLRNKAAVAVLAPATGVATTPPFVVREYAHQRLGLDGTNRPDWTDTVLWHPVLVLPETGRTKLHFQISDDETQYRVLVAGHTADGRVGAVTGKIDATNRNVVGTKEQSKGETGLRK